MAPTPVLAGGGPPRNASASERSGVTLMAFSSAKTIFLEILLSTLEGGLSMRLGMRWATRITSCLFGLSLFLPSVSIGQQYKNFRVAVYIPVFVVKQMQDPGWLQRSWETISRQVKVDKVYIETYRSHEIADEQLPEQVKKFFSEHGVQVAGGIAFTGNESHQFESFWYTDPDDREYVKHVSELTGRHFDEIILDDFFFVNSKKDSDITAKGNKSWTNFRLDLMDEAAQNLVIEPIKKVNPKARVIIKFPNWYEHFPGLGLNPVCSIF
jgi:hypothetical protein